MLLIIEYLLQPGRTVKVRILPPDAELPFGVPSVIRPPTAPAPEEVQAFVFRSVLPPQEAELPPLDFITVQPPEPPALVFRAFLPPQEAELPPLDFIRVFEFGLIPILPVRATELVPPEAQLPPQDLVIVFPPTEAAPVFVTARVLPPNAELPPRPFVFTFPEVVPPPPAPPVVQPVLGGPSLPPEEWIDIIAGPTDELNRRIYEEGISARRRALGLLSSLSRPHSGLPHLEARDREVRDYAPRHREPFTLEVKPPIRLVKVAGVVMTTTSAHLLTAAVVVGIGLGAWALYRTVKQPQRAIWTTGKGKRFLKRLYP